MWNGLNRAFVSWVVVGMLGTSAWADKPEGLSPQTLKLPNGPTSLKGLGESFSPNIAMGGGSYSIPIEVPPSALKPKVALSYSTGSGRGEAGLGFRLPKFSIYRTTDKGLPDYDEQDRFAVASPEFTDELVLVNFQERYYRLKNEGGFALFHRDIANNRWVVHLKNGQLLYLGEDFEGREATSNGTYRWWLQRHEDAFGHGITYRYFNDRGHCYLSEIRYQLHASAAYQNWVEFEYETRPDVMVDYTYGNLNETRKRLYSIVVSQGEVPLRTYVLQYQLEDLFSLLTSVQMTGRNNETMPALTLSYGERSQESEFVVMGGGAPVEYIADGTAILEDVNGDGLPDILHGLPNDYRYYENKDGQSFSPTPLSLSNSPDLSIWDHNSTFADMDGDGFRDVVFPFQNNFRYKASGRIVDGRLQGYEDFAHLYPSGVPTYDIADFSTKLVDLNLDGRTDFLVPAEPGKVRAVYNLPNETLQESFSIGLPSLDISLSDPNTSLMDINGDGHLDFVVKEIGYSMARLRVWFGLGKGRFTDNDYILGGVPVGSPSDLYFQDVNRDGQTDLIRISGDQVRYYFNNGLTGFPTYQGLFNGMPSGPSVRRILFQDMNGNGTIDIVWLTTDNKLKYLDMMVEPYYGLLTQVDNGMGLVTTMSYRTSTDYLVEAKSRWQPWKSPLRRPIPVLSELSTTDSFNALGLEPTIERTTFDYRDGYYDGKEREFRGFGYVKTTQHGDEKHEGKVMHSWFHVGRNLETGDDEEILKGKRLRQRVEDTDGNLFQTVETLWEQRWLCQEDLDTAVPILPECAHIDDKDAYKDSLVALAVKRGQLIGHFEKTEFPKFTYEGQELDVWGNAIRRERYGEVQFPGGHTFGSAFGFSNMEQTSLEDEVSLVREYINTGDPTNWLVGYLKVDEIWNGAAMVSHSRNYYDGTSFVGLALGEIERGLVTKKEAWYHNPLGIDDEFQGESFHNGILLVTHAYEYDVQGQLTAAVDSGGQPRFYEHDAETGFFVVGETLPLDGLTLEYSAEYDRALGVLTKATDYNGNITEFQYDGMGRMVSAIGPEDSPGQPGVRYSYHWGTPSNPISVTVTETLLDRETNEYKTMWSYTDGGGRSRITQVEGDLGEYILKGWSELSERGKPTVSYDPYAIAQESHSNFLVMPPIRQDGVRTTMRYDALDRVVRTYAPPVDDVTLYSRTEYLPLETRVFDERDTHEETELYPAITLVDGLGRVVNHYKYNDIDGVRTPLRWEYTYDANGNITGIRDPGEGGGNVPQEANVRSFTYDSFKHLVRVEDPNSGLIDYSYNLDGQMIRREDALGQVTRWDYAFGRLTKAYSENSIHGYSDDLIEFSYDSKSDLFGSTDENDLNLLGNLSEIRSPIGRIAFAYDEQGQAKKQIEELWEPGVSTMANQTRSSFVFDTTYDPTGKVTSQLLPGGMKLHFGYSRRSLVTSVQSEFNGSSFEEVPHIQYDVKGQITNLQMGNGTTTCRTYSDRGNVLSVDALWGSNGSCDANSEAVRIQALEYSYGVGGLLASVQDNSPVVAGIPRMDATYSYDRLYQLTQVQTPKFALGYQYDAIQNLRSRTIESGDAALLLGEYSYGEIASTGDTIRPNALVSAGGVSYSYNELGQLQSYNGFDLRFDPNGRLVEASHSDGRHIRHYYDYGNEIRISLFSSPGKPPRVFRYVSDHYQERDGEATWLIEAGGIKIGEIRQSRGLETTLPLLDQLIAYYGDDDGYPLPVVEELMPSNIGEAIDSYWGQERVGTGTLVRTYYHNDHLGSATHQTDSKGNRVGHTSYYAYGKSASQFGERPLWGFAATRNEPEMDVGLMRMGARWYAPDLGRWVSPDLHFIESPTQALKRPLEMNGYSYGSNNPIKFTDPQGEAACAGACVAAAAWVGKSALEGVSDAALDKVIAKLAGEEYGWWDATKSFGVGFGVGIVGGGVLSKAKKIKKITELMIKYKGRARGMASQLRKLGGPISKKLDDILGKGGKKAVQETAERGGCFVAGTQVATLAGWVAIEDLREGDLVWSWDHESYGEDGRSPDERGEQLLELLKRQNVENSGVPEIDGKVRNENRKNNSGKTMSLPKEAVLIQQLVIHLEDRMDVGNIKALVSKRSKDSATTYRPSERVSDE